MEAVKIKPAPITPDTAARRAEGSDGAISEVHDAQRERRSWLRTLVRGVVSIVLIALIFAAAKAFQGYLMATKPAPPKVETKERARPVDAVTAKVADVRPRLRVYGQIFAGRSVDLRMLVAGEVMSVSPRLVEGGRVAKDEPLVTIDAFEYDGALVRARAELAEAEHNVVETVAKIELEMSAKVHAEVQRTIAQREVERLQKLVRKDAVSAAALDASQTRLSAANAAYEQRLNQIPVLEAQRARQKAALDRLAWGVRRAERDLQNTVLKTPFEGVVSNVAAEAGRLLNVSDRVATLIDLDRFEVRFTLTDAQYGRLIQDGRKNLSGRPVTVVWQGGGAELRADGAIDRVSPVVTSATGGFEVFARLKRSAETEAMRPGAFVAVITDDTEFDSVVSLPETALHPGNKVFAISNEQRLIEIPVTVAGYDSNAVLVRGDIANGARIMASRLPDAAPGVLVAPRAPDSSRGD